MPVPERRRLLILGGTAEAAALAKAAAARFADELDITTSLAGLTSAPANIAGALRIGGFGGAAGLAAYLREAGIDLMIDATHPFAARISHQARLSAETARVARLLLLRPPWQRTAGDRWFSAPSMAAAAALVPPLGKRVFLTVGARALAAFATLHEIHFLVRLIAAPKAPLPLAAAELILGRGPFAFEEELALLRRHAIDLLVCKASGGSGTAAKLAAARELRLPVIMVERPPPEPGPCVASIGEALDWIAGRLGGAG